MARREQGKKARTSGDFESELSAMAKGGRKKPLSLSAAAPLPPSSSTGGSHSDKFQALKVAH